MTESQNIEWKESWRDEYLKWICGFANAQGGKIYIGTRDDGIVIGVSNAKKLLEDIPNKIQNKLGIVADVNLLAEGDLEYIEIVVNPWSFPVNYNVEDIMVKFKALQSAKVPNSKVPNVTKDVTKSSTMEEAIFVLIKRNVSITTTEMAEYLSVNRRTIQRGLNALKNKGVIKRKGGKRYGYWEIQE